MTGMTAMIAFTIFVASVFATCAGLYIWYFNKRDEEQKRSRRQNG